MIKAIFIFYNKFYLNVKYFVKFSNPSAWNFLFKYYKTIRYNVYPFEYNFVWFSLREIPPLRLGIFFLEVVLGSWELFFKCFFSDNLLLPPSNSVFIQKEIPLRLFHINLTNKFHADRVEFYS